VGAFYFQRKAAPLYTSVRERVGFLSTRLNNNFSGILTIKSFTREEQEAKKVRQESQEYLDANQEAIKVSSAFSPIIRMGVLAGFMGTFILGAYRVFQGQLEVGHYGMLIFLTQRILWPMTAIAHTVDLFERAMASTRRILDLIETTVKIRSGNISPAKITWNITFQDIHFHYGNNLKVLEDINLSINDGETIAFVGKTGSGKSSLIKLLLRFYDATSGKLFLNQQDITDYEIKNLRREIGLVSQDVFLFHGTIRENLLFGNPEATQEQLEEACLQAEALEFINALPSKLDTLIGERGQKLSGGQKQRLSLARALLKNPSLLILDEATSAVDNETEAAIQRSLKEIVKGRTTIIIAHRLSTVIDADRIYVLSKGKIREQGSHRELVENGAIGIYRHLWQVQTGLKNAIQ
jgi:ATP-binding cassette subfamily B protein